MIPAPSLQEVPEGKNSILPIFLFAWMFIPMSLSSADPQPNAPRFVKEWGKHGTGQGEFDFPIGIALTRSGELLVSDFYNSRVQRFSPEGDFLTEYEVLPNPGAMVLDREENLYLTHFSAMRQNEDPKPSRITVYDPQGKLLRTWGVTGKGNGEFDYPGGMAISRDDRLYVADQTNHRIQVFDLQGKFLFKWGSYGNESGEFGGKTTANSRVGGPQFIAIDREGMIFTTEGANCRIQKFTPEGKFVAAWGDAEDRVGGFGGKFPGFNGPILGPIALCFDDQDHLWITTTSSRIQQFNRQGQFLRSLGAGGGTEPGEFLAPHMLVPDGKGHLFIVDSYNHRIQKFWVGPSR